MPIYEYECDGCKEVFEVRQKISDPPPAQHACGSDRVHRILSATTFVLKGTGWYKTDYADKPAPAESAKAQGDAGGGTDKAGKGAKDAKAEAKPAPGAKPTATAAGPKADKKGSTPAA